MKDWKLATAQKIHWQEDCMMFDCECGRSEIVLMGGESKTCSRCSKEYRFTQRFEVKEKDDSTQPW